MAKSGSTSRRALMAAAAWLAVVPAVSPAGELRLELTGMIAFVPTADDGFEVLLVNELDNPTPGVGEMTHFPQLEVACEDLVDATDASACEYWASTADRLKRIISLSRGFDVSFETRGTGAVQSVDNQFEELVVPMQALTQGKAELATLRSELRQMSDPEEFRDHAIVRVRLNGGAISADSLASDEEGWTFRANGRQVHPAGCDDLQFAAIVTWTAAYEGDLQVTLSPFEAPAEKRVLVFRDLDPLVLTLSNEPDPLEFCAHVPASTQKPFEHFASFYALTKHAEDDPDVDLRALPLPFPNAAALDAMCPKSGGSPLPQGRRVTCVPVRFPNADDTGDDRP